MSPLADRLAVHEEEILDAVLIPVVTTEPEHTDVTAELVRAVLDRVLDRGSGSDRLGGVGRRYAESGVSYARAVHELHRTIIEMSRRWWAAVAAADVGAMLVIGQNVDDRAERMRAELSDGYCAVLAGSGTRSLGRRQLAEFLLTGQEAGPFLRQAADVELAGCYLVLCAVVTRPLDDAARAMGTPGALSRRDGDRLDVLVPVGRRALQAPGEVAQRGFQRLAAATGVTVAGAAVGMRDSLPAAAKSARTAMEVGSACGRTGAVLIGQVLVECAMTGSAPAVRELADLIASLARWPHLPVTLVALYDHDLDRSRTADHLHIARRTLTKRLDRIHQLTGIHPTTAYGIQTFLTALAADRLADRSEPAPVRAG